MVRLTHAKVLGPSVKHSLRGLEHQHRSLGPYLIDLGRDFVDLDLDLDLNLAIEEPGPTSMYPSWHQ